MKTAIRFVLATALCGAAYAQAADTAVRREGSSSGAAAAVKASARPKGLPDAAIEVEPGIWRHVAQDGRVWFYRRTPFGFTKSEESPDEVKAQTSASGGVTVVESGDSLKFSRPSPFGPYRWTRKKSELNEFERAVWEGSHGKNASSGDATSSAGQKR
jgi:hypothetical protein